MGGAVETKVEPPDDEKDTSGMALLFLTGKAFLQSFHAPILFELAQGTGTELRPRPVIHIPQPLPQLRVVGPKFPQLVNALQRT